ncbi:uncharacterized protein LOC123554177 [Mercenaria mercenaria]|uniref:uncharacterized protein LOC123554177 n=1 Tax=Mercenaria mercenaria TaxID=6596 RepID=UPI00234E4E53|nr:uncharacterized protein LOC123554177 [Mercenaria mercenaria]
MAINRCMQCEESLCHACTNAHLKMKASRYHRQHVVPLADQSITNYPDRSRSQKNCWRHRNEEIKFVCKECDVVLCLICKLLEHEHHVTKPISEEANEVRRRLASLLQKQIGLGEKLQMKIRETETRKTQYPHELEQELTKLNYQASQMHAEIENEKQKSEKELKHHYGDHLSKYETDRGHLTQDYEKYRAANTEALQLLNSNNDVYVVGKGMFLYDRLNEMECDIRDTSETSSIKPAKRFQYGSIDTQQIQSMMGYVSENDSRSSLSPQRFEHRQMSADGMFLRESSMAASSIRNFKLYSKFVIPFTDGMGYVYGIAPVSQSRAWITLLDHETVVLIDIKGNILSSADVGDVCEDVTANLDGECYITCPRTKCIKRVGQNGQVEEVVSRFRQDPHGICLSQFGNTQDRDPMTELYVCFTETRGSTVSLYDNQKGCLRVFSENGDDVGRSFHLQAPVRVDVHHDSNTLCVSDHSNGCVMISDLSGQFVKAIYTGENDEEMFKPLGVCFDSVGNVIIAEWSGNQVILVSQEGEYIKTLITDIEGPQSVAFKNGLLWVGGRLGKVNVYSMN